jgi:myo-inositol-1-phosphate synthase
MPLLESLKEPLEAIRRCRRSSTRNSSSASNGPNVKKPAAAKMDYAEADGRHPPVPARGPASRALTMIWCGSTEVYHEAAAVHPAWSDFECGLQKNDPEISPSQIYAYAALKSGVPYANGAPHLTTDMPALLELARDATLPLAARISQERPDVHEDADRARAEIAHAGRERLVLDQHSGQPRRRSAGRSGLVPVQGRISKIGARTHFAEADCIRICTRTSITRCASNYYPPRGDAKEGWDNIDIFGWLGYPMQIKIDFLCRDSILAAPLVLDLVLFMDLAQRAGMRGIQEWLSFYFKAPMHAPEVYPEHDIFIQLMKLKNTLRWMRGEDLITHLGLEYYDYRSIF